MHGVKRDRTQQTAELKAQRKEKEAKKIQVYLDVERQFLDVRASNDVSEHGLEASTALLAINPEYYTAWNYRRRVLGHLFGDGLGEKQSSLPPKDFFASLRAGHEDQSSDGRSEGSHAAQLTRDGDARDTRTRQLLQHDLELTMQALQMHPKVYWIWNHRKWCLQELPCEDEDGLSKWKMELQMVNKMLEFDARNFHGWDYRRYILTQLAYPKTLTTSTYSALLLAFPQSLRATNLPDALKAHQLALAKQELAYTLRKIEANFSNFSAWHQRSLFLPAIWAAERLTADEARRARDEEFELLRQAMFVDPEDESVWTYHDWLVSLDPSEDVLDRELESIRQLLDLEPESRWCMQTLAHYLTVRGGKENLAEARMLLESLQKMDPNRKQRYAELTVG